MAILDAALMFDQAAAITVSRASTNTVDLGTARDLGVDDPLKVLIYITTPFAGGTSLQAQFQGSIDNSTWSTFAEGPAVPTASLTVGGILMIGVPRPPTGTPIPRYLRVNYVVVGTMTAGAVTATLVLDLGAHIYYPPGVTVYN